MPMTCVLIVPDGMGLRNFIYSRFLDCFQEGDRAVVWHALPADMLPDRPASGVPIAFQSLPPHREGLTERVLRQAKVYGQLYWRRQDGTDRVLQGLGGAKRPLNAAVGLAAKAVGRVAGMSSRLLKGLDQWHATISGRHRRVEAFEAALRVIRPDVVFCTHQRASRAVPAMLAARRLKIPTATFIYSWDNLPKGRMAVHADHFFVWSDHMKAELLGYYPEVAGDRVHVVGTPQFEAYFNPSLREPRRAFLERLGLDPDRPVVCFSGDDVTTSPHDPVYLDDLASVLKELPETNRPQIVFRRCPVDESGRYQSVLDRHPDIVVSDPLWRSRAATDWTGAAPLAEDAAVLANLACHSDLVVNLASTMVMDFAVLDKPGIFLAYQPAAPRAGEWTASEIYRLPHMKTVHELQPAYWVRSREELAPVVMHALAHPEEKRAARVRWIERLARGPLDQASHRCYEALLAVAQQRGRRCTSGS
jgi:hypothetical protein